MPVSWAEPWDRVRRRCPVASMTRATHQYPFTDSFLDDLFDDSAPADYSPRFLFSDRVGVLTGVVFSAYPSVRRALLDAPAASARGALGRFDENLQTTSEEGGRTWDGSDLASGAEPAAELRASSAAQFGPRPREAAKGMDPEYDRKATRGPEKPKGETADDRPIDARPDLPLPPTTRTVAERKLAVIRDISQRPATEEPDQTD